MKNGILIAIACIALISLSLTVVPSSGTEPCGELIIGNFSLDMAQSDIAKEMPGDMLIDNFKQGVSFAGTAKCPGSYEIVSLVLTVKASGGFSSEYDLELLRKMQSMEDYMLVRYFNNAEKLTFVDMRVKNAAGDIQSVPSLTVVVK